MNRTLAGAESSEPPAAGSSRRTVTVILGLPSSWPAASLPSTAVRPTSVIVPCVVFPLIVTDAFAPCCARSCFAASSFTCTERTVPVVFSISPWAGEPGLADSADTRTSPAASTTSPWPNAPVCSSPSDFCHFFSAAAVAEVNFLSGVPKPPNPHALRFSSSCLTSAPSSAPAARSR